MDTNIVLQSEKLAKFAQLLGILNNTFKSTFVREFSRINVYNALEVPILVCG